MTPPTTSGAAIQRYKIGYHADEWGQRSSTPSGIPDASGSWVRYADHVTALAAGQATAAQAVVQDDLITIRKPTTSAEMLWLLKLAHLVISDVDKTLEETFAPAQPAAQQGVAYADAHGTIMGAAYDFRDAHISGSPNQKRSAHAALESAATHTLRASHGQAPANHARITELESQLAQRFDPTGRLDLIEAYAETAAALQAVKDALAAGRAAQQGAAYAALSESFLEIPDVQDESGINAYYSREAVLECIDAALASHGQAPASVLHLVHSAFAEIAMAFPKAFAMHKVGIADTAVREALAGEPVATVQTIHGVTVGYLETAVPVGTKLYTETQPVAREPLTDEQIQDLLLCGNPTDEEMRLIRIGWDAAHGIKGGQHG